MPNDVCFPGPLARSGGAKKPADAALMRRVHKKVLDNGLRIFVVESPELPVVSHMVWYTVGARDERSGETGVSHFLEHMMFKGTDAYPKGSIDAITARNGGGNNAFTDKDTTSYYFNLKSDRWTAALDIEASRMQGCLLDPHEFASEKKVVLEELAMGEDEPWSPLFEAVESMAYRVHPYHNPIIGWREDLERLERDAMMDYYRRHYTPDRAVVVIVGDVQHRDVFKQVEDKLGSIPSSGVERAPVLAEPPQRGERRVIVRFPGNLPRLAVAWHTCRVGERGDPICDLVSELLSGGRASRLYRSLVQGKEIATSAAAYNEARLDPGLFWVIAEGKPGTDVQKLEDALLEEIHRLRDEGPTAAELKRAKKQLRTSFYFDLETVSNQAMRLGRYEVSCPDGHEVLRDYPAEIEAIDAKTIREAMAEWFQADNRTVGWSLPPESEGGSTKAARKTTRKAKPKTKRPASKPKARKKAAKKASAKKSSAKKASAKKAHAKKSSKKKPKIKKPKRKVTAKTKRARKSAAKRR